MRYLTTLLAILAMTAPARAQEITRLESGWTMTTRLGRLTDVNAVACTGDRAAARGWSGQVAVFEGGAWRSLPEIPGWTEGRTYGTELAMAPRGASVLAEASGRIAEWSGQAWTVLEIPGGERYERLGGILALSASEAYVVGRGSIGRRDGARFVRHDPGTWRDLSAVAGASGRDLWIAGQGGTAMRWDGRAWTRTATRTESWIDGLTADGATVWAWTGGRHGRRVYPGEPAILRWDGRAWSPVASPSDESVTAIAARAGRTWALTATGLFERRGEAWAPVLTPAEIGDDRHLPIDACATDTHLVVGAGLGTVFHRPL